jgi:hypothetical protein
MTGLFKTPESVEEINEYCENCENSSEAYTAIMLFQNYVYANYDLTPKTKEE